MEKIKVLIVCLIGSFIFALGVNCFLISNDLGEGGVTGITFILYYLYDYPTWITSLILNSILMIMGYKFLSKKTAIYTVITVIFISIALAVTENFGAFTDDILVASIAGGMMAGIGLGMILRVGSTSAGSTIIARLMQKYLGWNVSYALLLCDMLVVLASIPIIGFDNLVYTIVMLVICTKIMDYIIEGYNSKKAVTIISEKHEEIGMYITNTVGRGVTVLNGYGYYTKQEKNVIYTIVNRAELASLRNAVKEIDKNSFFIVHDVRDVIGEGFEEEVSH